MGNKAILVIDDDETILRACQRAMAHHARVFTAATPAQARKLARTEHLDAIVVDYLLGDRESGVDLVRELKIAAPNARILLWSAYASTQTAVAAMRAGADDVRSKSVTVKALLRWLETESWEVDDDDGLEMTATLERVAWDHVRRVVADCKGNRSEAARRLGVQRLTLRRHLEKGAPRR